MCVGSGSIWKSLYFPLSISVKLKIVLGVHKSVLSTLKTALKSVYLKWWMDEFNIKLKFMLKIS